MLPLQSGEGAGETPSVCQPEYCSWGGLRFHGYKPWELRGDGAMMYTDTDPHRSVRKIATDLLSHWPYIFIVSGKSRPAYQRLIILQQRVNCKEGVFKHPFRHPDRSLNKEWGPHNESQHVCECACLGVCVQVCGTQLWQTKKPKYHTNQSESAPWQCLQSSLQSSKDV